MSASTGIAIHRNADPDRNGIYCLYRCGVLENLLAVVWSGSPEVASNACSKG
jgi:hypothetical protein